MMEDTYQEFLKKKTHHKINLNTESIYSFEKSGFKCFFPNKPTIKKIDLSFIQGELFYSVDSINVILYTVQILYNDKRNALSNLKDTTAFIYSYLKTYIFNTPKFNNAQLLSFKRNKIKLNYPAYEYKFSFKVNSILMYQYGIVLINNKKLYKISLQFPKEQTKLGSEIYLKLINSFSFI